MNCHKLGSNRSDKEGGYVAVITAIVVTLIMSLISLVTSNTSYLGRVDTTRLESKAMSRQVADACLDHARLRLSYGGYIGNETVSFDTFSCYISPITTASGNKTITAKATVDNKTTKLELVVSATNLTTVTLKEL